MTNTKTTNKHILNRSRAAVITVLLLLGFLVYRLADLQLIHPDENRNNAILQYTNEVTINAKRGTDLRSYDAEVGRQHYGADCIHLAQRH